MQLNVNTSKPKVRLSALAPEYVAPVTLDGVGLETVDFQMPGFLDHQHRPWRK